MTTQNQAAVAPLRMALVGDLMVGDAAIATGYGFASRWGESNVSAVVEKVRPLLAGHDIVIANLECVLSRTGFRGDDWQSAQMRGWPAYARAMADMGITHVTLANNHATQHGMQAFHETVDLLRGVGITVCGLGGSNGWCAQPVITAVRGARVGVLGYSLRPRQYCKTESQPYAEATAAAIRDDVARLRTDVDTLVVTLHWGEEYGLEPSAHEVAFARELVTAGVHVVHGHHPHVIRPVEQFGSGVIAYSLGNFLSDLVWQEEFRQTAVWQVTIGDTLQHTLAGAYIGGDYVPAAVPHAPWCRSLSHDGLGDADYEAQTNASLMLQRHKAYVHALKNLPRFNQRVLRQVLFTTLKRRVRSLAGRLRRS